MVPPYLGVPISSHQFACVGGVVVLTGFAWDEAVDVVVIVVVLVAVSVVVVLHDIRVRESIIRKLMVAQITLFFIIYFFTSFHLYGYILPITFADNVR
jgi:hypothetical protein